MQLLISVLLWCESSVLFEYFGKIALIVKTYSNRNINDRVVCICKQILTFLYADIIQIFLERGPERLLKKGRKIRGIQVNMACGILQSDRLIVILRDKLDSVFNNLTVFVRGFYKHAFNKKLYSSLKLPAEVFLAAGGIDVLKKIVANL